jgi:hypothetical protein
MRCDDIQAHIPDHLAGALPAAAAGEMAAHLRTCEACAREVDAAEDTWQRLRTMPAARADSGAMRARFDAALEGYQHGSVDRRAAWWTPARYGLQLAAAAALLLIGVAVGRGTVGAPPADPQIAELRGEVRDMREMVALALLQQQSAGERLRGVSYTSQIDQPGSSVTTALLDTLLHDPNVNVRLVTIDALRRFSEHEAVRRGALEALSAETAPLVQIALIDFTIDVNGREAEDVLRRLSTDPMVDVAVRARAARGLAELGA